MVQKEHILLQHSLVKTQKIKLGNGLPGGQCHLSFKPLQMHKQNASGIQVIYLPVSVWLQWL